MTLTSRSSRQADLATISRRHAACYLRTPSRLGPLSRAVFGLALRACTPLTVGKPRMSAACFRVSMATSTHVVAATHGPGQVLAPFP
jgi:hypothetical protein